MEKMYFGTQRLVCQPLKKTKDIPAFCHLINEPHVQEFFRIGDAFDFLQELESYACFPVGVFCCAKDRKLIGYINGYVYNRANHELLVEFFLSESYYNFDYVSELLNAYVNNCRKIGFTTFLFHVQETDTDLLSFMSNMTAAHLIDEDFTDESGRNMQVYRIL